MSSRATLLVTSSLEGMRMSLQLRRIGGISEEERAADVDGKVAEILKNADCVEAGGGSGTPAAPLLLSASRKGKHPAANSGSAAGNQPVNRGVRQRERVVANTRYTSRRSATRWCGFTLKGARTHCIPSMQALGHSSRSTLGSNSTYGLSCLLYTSPSPRD